MMKKAVLFLTPILFMLIFPTNVFALDTRYIDTTLGIWGECEKDTVLLTELDNYSGMLQYFYEDNCFYAHISYSESHMLYSDNDVLITARLHHDNRDNSFTFNKDGFVNTYQNSKKDYKLYQGFGNDSEYGQEIYFIIELLNSEDKETINFIDLGITINGYRYQICSDLQFGAEKETTTKPEKTTKKDSSKAAGSSEAKSNTKSTATSQKTTKYKYSSSAAADSAGNKYAYDENNEGNEAYDTYENEETNQNSIITENETAAETSLSPQSKLLIALACVFTAAACAFFVKAFINSKASKKPEPSANNEQAQDSEDISENPEDFDD